MIRMFFFIDFLTQKIIEYLELKQTDSLVDLGCGTGIYSKSIVAQLPLQSPIICVDTSEKMLEQVPKNSQYQRLVKDAVTFAEESVNYDKILIKEMIHHIKDKEKLFQGIFKQLNPGGIFLLILLPPTIEYPLFLEALSLYESQQPNYRDLMNLLTKIGFKTTVNLVEYPVSIAKEKYFHMVANRYLSLLSEFNDQELQQGLMTMKQKYQNQSILKFCDRFVFITAHKPS